MLYPDFFSCPNWSYNKQTTEHLRRVQFDNGWTRQRKRFAARNNTVSLSLTMSSAEFASWSAWWVNNAYDWFEMTLAQGPATVRSVSPINYSYQVFDTINVSVTVEEYVEVDGQNTPVPLPPQTGLPPIPGTETFCLEYECGALELALAEQGFDEFKLSAGAEAFPWPFAADEADQELPTSYADYVSSPNVIADWGSTYLISDMAGWDWYDTAKNFVACGISGEVTRVTDVVGYNVTSTTRAKKYTAVPSSGSAVNMVFTTYQGGTTAGGEIARNPSAKWEVYLDDVLWSSLQHTFHTVNLVSAGPSVWELQLFGQGTPNVTVSVPVGDLQGRWSNLSYSETSWYESVPDPVTPTIGIFRMWCTVIVTLTNDIDSYTGAMTYYEDWAPGNTGVFTADLIADPNKYINPSVFEATTSTNFMTVSALALYSGDAVIDHTLIAESFELNFTDYEDPDEDCIPLPTSQMTDPIATTVIVDL